MNIIKASEVQKGDRIKVTVKNDDRATTYEGVANHSETPFIRRRWRTAGDLSLWTDVEHAVIELLDRPKPKVKVPTAKGAVVKYVGRNGLGTRLNRTAIRDEHGVWKSYDDAGWNTITSDSDEVFADRMSYKEDFTVIFEGVGK